MAAKEPYDYLSAATPDYDAFLGVEPKQVLTETLRRNQVIHTGDDESEEVITLDGGAPVVYFTLLWPVAVPADSGTILDFWADAAKGNGIARSFKFAHPGGHTYVVRFTSEFTRQIQRGLIYHSITECRLKVLGVVADA